MSEKSWTDLTQNYLLLRGKGAIERLEGGDWFWDSPAEELDEIGEN